MKGKKLLPVIVLIGLLTLRLGSEISSKKEALQTNKAVEPQYSSEELSPLDCASQEVAQNNDEDLLATLTNQPEDNMNNCLFAGCGGFF